MRSWLISLPHDLKILYEATADPDLERASRELAVGAIIYCVSPSDYVSSDRSDFSSYADDCIMRRRRGGVGRLPRAVQGLPGQPRRGARDLPEGDG
jgi:hypothetical protein